MKIIEGIQLKNTIKQIRKYQSEHKGFDNLYRELDSLNINSLQSFSFQNDSDFFDEVSFVLSVINSIIVHPHIISKTEDIVIRAELAGHIEHDQFQKVMRESNLWKQKEFDMVPEYVYHHHHLDELKIYENIFIGMLIKLLDQEINKYYEFYVSILPSIDNRYEIVLENESIENALTKVDRLQRKLRHIKNSYFYKEIKKCDLSLKKIQPTNILLKDRLYNYCFKFYRKFIAYEDLSSLQSDFRTYYMFQLLKALNKKGFVLDTEANNTSHNVSFIYKDYKVNLLLSRYRTGISFTISYNDVKAKHYLYLNTERVVKDETIDYKNSDQFNTIDIITIWNLYSHDNIKEPIFKRTLSEDVMIYEWLNMKFEEIIVKKDVYQKYCPVCRSKNLDMEKGYFECSNCHTQYVFKNQNEMLDTVWFMRIKRG